MSMISKSEQALRRAEGIGISEAVVTEPEFMAASRTIDKALEHGFSVQEINGWLSDLYLEGLYRADKMAGLLAPSRDVLKENPNIGLDTVCRDMDVIRVYWQDAIDNSITVTDIKWDTTQENGYEPDASELGLPYKVAVPFDVFSWQDIENMKNYDYDCISDFLSDKYGFCVYSFSTNYKLDEMLAEAQVPEKKADIDIDIRR